RPLIQLHRVRADDALHASPSHPAVLDVSRLQDPEGRQQVGDLSLDTARLTPVSDVRCGRLLDTVLQLADSGVVLPCRTGECPPRKAGIFPDLTKAGTQRLKRGLGS